MNRSDRTSVTTEQQAPVGAVRARVGEVEATVEENPEQYAWMFHARCRGIDPAEFFPSDGTGVETAQRVCAACPVTSECLEYALLNRIEHGVWGGASERERRRILRRRRDVAAQQV